jgi:hypothetical protein
MSRPIWFQVIVHDNLAAANTAAKAFAEYIANTAAEAFAEYMGGKTPHRLHVTHGCRPLSFKEAQDLSGAARQLLDPGDELVFATRLEDDGPEHIHGWMFCGWDRR